MRRRARDALRDRIRWTAARAILRRVLHHAVQHLPRYRRRACAKLCTPAAYPPPIREANGAYETYAKLLARVKTQNEKYYARFPEDVARWRDIGSFVSDSKKIVTPAGSTFSLRGLQALGFSALGVAGGFERLHYQLETAWEGEGDDKRLSYAFLKHG